MANSGDGRANWADIVNTLINTFQILRDIFGYALPGFVFAAIGVASGRIQLQQIHELFKPYDPPMWILVGLGIAGCYVVGNLLACIAYLPTNIRKLCPGSDPSWLEEHPTEVNSDDLYWRHFYPKLLEVLDRRETQSILKYSTLAAMLVGSLLFCVLHLTFCWTIVAISAFVFVDSLMTMGPLRRARKAIHKAGIKIQTKETGTPAQAAANDARLAVAEALQAAADALKKT